MSISKEDKKVLINLICKEQVEMIVKDSMLYESEYYNQLEKLKVDIKDWE